MKVTVLGAGSWGTTLALVLNQNNHSVTCWSVVKNDIESILTYKENKKFLPGINIPDTINFTDNLQESVDFADIIIVAIPSHAVRPVIQGIDLSEKTDLIWVNVAKGIENQTLLRVSQVIEEVGHVPAENVCVLFGPSHAEEVSREIPTAIVSASKSQKTATMVQHLFMTPYFRVYANLDIIGVELGNGMLSEGLLQATSDRMRIQARPIHKLMFLIILMNLDLHPQNDRTICLFHPPTNLARVQKSLRRNPLLIVAYTHGY